MPLRSLVSFVRLTVRSAGRFPPLVWGFGAFALVTIYVVGTGSSPGLYDYNEFLLALVGALALQVLMGTAGQVSVGNGTFLLVGGFASVWLTNLGAPFPLDVIGAALICGALGGVVALPAIRLSGMQLALATLAAFFIAGFFADLYQSDANSGNGFVITPLFNSFGLVRGQQYWVWMLFGLAVVVTAGASRLMRGDSGRAFRMIRDHDIAASALGYAVTRYKLIIFVLSSTVIGLQGALTLHLTGTISTDTYTLIGTIIYVEMILIGGLDSIAGAYIGAAVLTAMPILIPDITMRIAGGSDISAQAPQIAQIISGALVIVMIVSSSRGIVGWLESLRRTSLYQSTARKLVMPSHQVVPEMKPAALTDQEPRRGATPQGGRR